VVVRRGPTGKATIYQNAGEAFGAREVFDAVPPWLPGFEPQPAFSLLRSGSSEIGVFRDLARRRSCMRA
jgi:hypothetical protein